MSSGTDGSGYRMSVQQTYCGKAGGVSYHKCPVPTIPYLPQYRSGTCPYICERYLPRYCRSVPTPTLPYGSYPRYSCSVPTPILPYGRHIPRSSTVSCKKSVPRAVVSGRLWWDSLGCGDSVVGLSRFSCTIWAASCAWVHPKTTVIIILTDEHAYCLIRPTCTLFSLLIL
jgi:hypothetical protein